MAIIIPSKYIYTVDNPKVIENYIDRVDIQATRVNQIVNQSSLVGEPIQLSTNYGAGEWATTGKSGNTDIGNGVYKSIAIIAHNLALYTRPLETPIIIEQKNSNSFIDSLQPLTRANVSISYEKITTPILAKIRVDLGSSTATIISTSKDNSKQETIENVVGLTEKDLLEASIEFNEYFSITATSQNLEEIEQAYVYYNSSTKQFSYLYDAIDGTIINTRPPKILCGSQKIFVQWTGDLGNTSSTTISNVEGYIVAYIPTEINVRLYGTNVSLNETRGTMSIGGGSFRFSIAGNELLQDTNYYQTPSTNQIGVLANNILNQYKNGKETATLLCAIGEYYNEDGTLAISTKNNGLPMTFDIGNEAIPMVYKIPKGGTKPMDTPMSLYSSGNAKVFTIVSVEPIYDGAVWQRVTLLEKMEQ